MRHARGEDLDRLEPLLTQLRGLDGLGLVERTPGAFYRKSKGFLHFHIDGDDIYADVKLTGPEFDRVRATTKREQQALLASVRRVLKT
jgi:hypothetical protein